MNAILFVVGPQGGRFEFQIDEIARITSPSVMAIYRQPGGKHGATVLL